MRCAIHAESLTVFEGSTILTRGGDCTYLQLTQVSLVNASSARVRTPTPLGPFGRYGLASSAHAVPAMSMCTHGSPPVNSFRNSAAVIDAAGRPPVFDRSAISLLSCSRYSSTNGIGQARSPARSATDRTCSTQALGVPKSPLVLFPSATTQAPVSVAISTRWVAPNC